MESSNVRGTCIVTMNRRGLLLLRCLSRLVRGWRRWPGTRRPFGIWLLELFLGFGVWHLELPPGRFMVSELPMACSTVTNHLSQARANSTHLHSSPTHGRETLLTLELL